MTLRVKRLDWKLGLVATYKSNVEGQWCTCATYFAHVTLFSTWKYVHTHFLFLISWYLYLFLFVDIIFVCLQQHNCRDLQIYVEILLFYCRHTCHMCRIKGTVRGILLYAGIMVFWYFSHIVICFRTLKGGGSALNTKIICWDVKNSDTSLYVQ